MKRLFLLFVDMQISRRLIFLVLTVLALCLPATGALAEGRKLALLIGINKYENLPGSAQLITPINDVRAAARVFEDLGFEVEIEEDPGQREFLAAVDRFSRKLTKDDTALFYYAGHGAAFPSTGIILLPSDVPAPAADDEREERRLAEHAVRESSVLDSIMASGAKVAIAVFDSCRNNPLVVPGSTTRSFGSGRGLAIIPARDDVDGLAVLYSAGRNQEALDRLENDVVTPDLTSVFARVFLKELRVPGLSFKEIASKTRKGVEELALTQFDSRTKAPRRQRPTVQDQLNGDFYFLPPVAAEVATVDETPKPQTESEAVIQWRLVEKSSSTAVVEAYLEKFGSDPIFAALAREHLSKLAALKADPPQATAAPKRIEGCSRFRIGRPRMVDGCDANNPFIHLSQSRLTEADYQATLQRMIGCLKESDYPGLARPELLDQYFFAKDRVDFGVGSKFTEAYQPFCWVKPDPGRHFLRNQATLFSGSELTSTELRNRDFTMRFRQGR